MTTGKQIQKAAGCETKGNAPICMYTVGLEVIARVSVSWKKT